MATRTVQGASLMVIAIGILVLPGILVNNLQNNGLISTSQTQTCNQQLDTCTLSANVGCQYSASFCQLQGSSISFLNPCSTWTNLLTLNYVGFVNSFFTNCGTAGAQGNSNALPQSGNVTIPGLVAVAGAGHLTGLLGQRQWVTSLTLHPVPQGITAPVYITCLSWNGTLAYDGALPNPSLHGKYYTSCNFLDSSSPRLGYTMNCWLFGTDTGGGTGDVNNAICTNFAQSTSGGLDFGSLIGFGLSLLGAAILIFMSLGINFGIVTATFGTNPQGTKLAQTYGMGLLLFMPLYSEFSTWFSNGYLPAGLDGNIFNGQLGIVSVVLVVCMFLGLYFVSQSGTTSQ